MICKNCIWAQQVADYCGLLRNKIDPNGEACQKYTDAKEIITCALCNKQILYPTVFLCGNTSYTICNVCAKKSGTCEMCKERFHCEFETNPSPIPKNLVTRTNNTVIQTNGKNPERVKITCQQGCPCWSDNYCLRESGTCNKYETYI